MNLKQFLLIGKAEGISSLLLFFVAMPLKYIFGMAEAVSIVGMLHGVLFVAYVGSALFNGFERKWKLTSFLLLALASILPGGPLYIDPIVIKREGETV
ncbi:MAG: integral membrane protein [Flammeovirgaceae bacterium]|jgi:integral membrane protein